MKKTTIYLPKEMAMAVAGAAKQQGTSEASVIREAIAAYVTTIDRPLPDFIGSVSVDGVEGAETEEWLQSNWQPE